MSTTPPPRADDHPDRFLDAQEAMEAAFLRIVDDAVEVGWGEVEAIAAVVSVAENHMLALGENEKVNRQIEDLRRRDIR